MNNKIAKLIAKRDALNAEIRGACEVEAEKVAWHVLQLAEQYRASEDVDRAAGIRTLWVRRHREWADIMRAAGVDGFVLAARYTINPVPDCYYVGMTVYDYNHRTRVPACDLTDDERTLADTYLSGRMSAPALAAVNNNNEVSK